MKTWIDFDGALGYAIPQEAFDLEFWYQRDFLEDEERWYVPWPVSEEKWKAHVKTLPAPLPNVRDDAKSTTHKIGAVPCVWIKNLPGGDKIDGACTFEKALKNAIEIDYQLSQTGRGFKYSMDPTLLLSEPAFQDSNVKELVKGAGNAITLSPEGSASMLEISGAAYSRVLDFCDRLRELGLENCSGNRSSPEKMMSAQSGRAMELMNYALIALADKLRTSYGEEGLLPLFRLLLKANANYELKIGKKTYKQGQFSDFMSGDEDLTLKWPDWYPPTPNDRVQHATAIATLREANVISRETATKSVQHDFDIEDPDKEIEKIKSEAQENVDLEIRKAKETRPYEYPPGGPKRQAAE